MENEEENGKPLDQDNESVSEDLWSDQEKDKEDENDEESDSNDSISGDSACDNVDGGFSSDSSGGGSEKCAICLQRFSGQEIGSPETCEHHFCLKCITEWSKKVATCPVDRKIFPAILVKQELFGSVTRIVDVEVGNTANAEHFDDYDTDPTYCEICGHCDREDRLLLCDGCDLGYHLECLEPPMEYVPIEDWYCTTCQVQRLSQAEQRIIERPTRQQIRLPRTGQSRRILQSIRQYVSRSILSVENDTPQTTLRRTPARKSQSRKRKRTTKGGKGTGRKSKRRLRKGKFKRSRVAIHRRPSTARGRIAAQLGILPPRPGQIYVGLPRCRATSAQSAENSNSSTLRNLRYQAGITPLRMYSNSEDLADYLEQYSDDEGSGGVARAHAVHHRIGIPLKPSIPAAAAGFFNVPALNSASPDVLGPILNNQIIMLTDRNIQIRRDGTLIPSISQSTPSSSTAVTSIRRNSITNENTKRGYESSSAENNCSLKLKGPSSIFRAPVNSCPSLSSVNGSVRQVPTSPNSSDSNSNADTGNNSNVCSSNSKNNGNNSENQLLTSSDYSGAPWKTDNSHGASMFCNDDPNGTKAYENYLYSASSKSPRSNTERRKSLEPSESEAKNPDDDEEYNIYSDIEEDNGQDTDTLKQAENESEAPMLKEKDRERDSDSDMVIDEDETEQVKNTYRDSKSIAESLPETHSGTNLETRSISPNENISTAFNLPSPNSIPLPDSTPPSSPPISINDDKDEDMETLPEHFISSPETDSENWCKNKTKGRAKEEYDPSQPLTSSDEDEPSGQMTKVPIIPRLASKEIKQQPEVKKPQVEVSVTEIKLNTVSPSKDNVSHSKSPADEEPDIDLNSIPMPPSEDYRRPTIQFSIPARHKLLSISSLIKRQKGVAKKENKSAMSFTSEISKAFGEEKQDESDDDDGRSEERGGRLSLVAEIFGSDDEEEKPVKLPQDDNHHSKEMHFLMKDVTDEQQPGKPTTTEGNPTVTQEAPFPAIRMASSLFVDEGHNSTVKLGTQRRQSMEVPSGWKNIAGDDDKIEAVVEPPGPTKEKETVIQDEEKSESAENDAGSCSDASIAVLQTVGHSKKKDDNDDVIVLNILSSEKRSEGSKKLRCGDKLHILESISDEDSEFESVSAKPTSNTRNIQKGSGKKIRTIDREQSRTEDHAKKSTKRKRSISVNNREEGEIIDSPGKQRKKKKEKKKGKKRRKSKEDTPVKFDFVEKKVPDAPIAVAANSSSEENMGGNQISWRKPSNSTKERNYRDGKPKADEKYFKPRDKKRDPSPNPRDRRGKHQREPSLTIEKDKTVKEKDLKRSRRRSHSPRSRSRSYSKSRTSSKRYHSRSNHGSVSPSKSFHSRSRSRSLRRSRKHGWFSTSPRRSRTRSNSRSPVKPRSRSPIKRSRYRKRSLSNNRPRRVKGRKRSVSSSSSTSSKRERRKRNKDKPVAIEKVKKKKEKERGKEKGHKAREPKEKEREKDKTKRKRRREKSLSPAKEIFADGDSIVVSLNFQKTPTVSSTPNHTSSTKDSSSPVRGNENEKGKSSKKDGRGRAHARHRRSHENDENGKPRLLKKTLLIDLESSPIQEQNIGVSPTLIVLSDDEEEKQLHRKSDRLDAKDSSNNKDGAVVTTSGCNDGHSNDGSSPYRHGVAADSTQLQHPNQSDSKMDDEPFSISCASVSPYENSNLSPTRGDSVVTSTRDSEIGLPHDNDSQSPPSFLHAKLSDAKNLHQPRSPGTPPQPVPPVSPPSHLMLDACNVNNSTPTSSVLSHNMPNHPTNSVSLPISDKPLIGNIPGLFPSSIVSASSTGSINIPPPIVIPTPPTPQMRFGTSQPPSLNQGLLMPPNVLASVANALYGPLLAARQQQQQQHLQQPQQQMNSSMLIGGKFSNSVNSSGGIGNKLNQQGSVLLPKNQNSHSLNYELGGGNVSKSNNSGRLAGDGDSPFSPNSSDGDDLFEPPLDRSKLDSSSGSNKPDKNLGQQSSNSSSQIQPSSAGGGNVGSGTGKSRDKNNLFDNLFGSAPSKKSSSHPKSHNKSAKSKGGTHQKSKTKRVAKKEISKLSEGELRLTEDVPTSAVELRVKEKFLKKLNRQERVVEEVKLSLKPHYSKKHVTKDEYKEILRRAVPKICHNKSGEINPFKIKELVEAYVKKFRHSRKIE